MSSGYKTITPIQFANVLLALKEGAIGGQSVRVYFACFALVAIREAATHYRKTRQDRPKELSCYRIRELERLTPLSPGAIKRALHELKSAGLLTYSEGAIIITKQALAGSNDLVKTLSCGRSPKRPIPVPRSMLRFLAQNRKESLAKTVVAYLLRGLSLSSHGEISNKGTVKVSWIAKTFNLSERAVKYSRTTLVGLGWVTRDTGSFQRKLNRDGAYFVINLAWSFTPRRNQVEKSKAPLVNREKPCSNFAPLHHQKCTDFAPPYKDRKTSYENKNQKTRVSEPPGILKPEKQKHPNLKNIERGDFQNFSRLESLYFQAIRANWIKPSEAMALNFVAAAVRSREVGRDPARVFVTIVRKSLWHHITQAQENYAHETLSRFREENPARFRCPDLLAA